MASPPNDASVEDIIEDLQLHEVILQSLDESRPDASEERQEVLDTIKGLETRLAQARGDPLPASQDYSLSSDRAMTPASASTVSRAQIDGGYDMSPFDNTPPRWDRSPSPLPLWPAGAQAPRSHGPFPIRKRQHNTDSSEDFRPPAKRIQSSDFPPSSNHRAESLQSSEDFDEGAGELRQLLGLDNEDTMAAFQDEQRKAEQWLKDRKEQERRDEEFARMLNEDLLDRHSSPASEIELGIVQDERREDVPAPGFRPGLFDEPQPRSALSSTSYSGSSVSFPMSPAPGPQPFPGYRQPAPATSRPMATPFPPSLSSKLRPSETGQLGRLSPFKQDSDDSDVQEITSKDFRPHHRNLFDRNRVPPYSPAYRLGANEKTTFEPDDPTNVYARPGVPHIFGGSPVYEKPSLAPQPLSYTPLGMAPLGSSPGPSGIPGPGPAYGPNVLQNTMARLNAGRELLQQAGKSVYGGLPSIFPPNEPYGGSRPLDPISHTMGFGFENPHYDSLDYLNDLYERGADPKKVNEEIKQLLENIRPDLEMSKQSREGTPEALKVSLLEHQKVGLTWMKSMEENESKGGILADDMGLGKTIQALALMVARPSNNPERKSTLVIAPVALMQQWKREIQMLLRPGRHQLSVFVLHGDKRATFRDLKEYDVVLTTFGTLASEFKRKEHFEDLHKKSGSSEPLPRAVVNSLPCLGPTSKWHRVVVDEAQCIKNRGTRSAQACCNLDATHRWCMSGTPMMNNVEELHSLLKFLRIRPYSALEKFNREFTRPLKKGGPSAEKAMKQLQVLLKAVLLRRTKYSKIDGRPILQLPPRVSEKIHAVFNADERDLYTALETKSQIQFNKYLKAGTVGRNYSNILVLLLRLRQACCHPHLMSDFSIKLENSATTNEVDLVANAKAFNQEVVIRLRDNENLECPICIDAVDNPIIFFPCGHSACAECFSRISDPALAVRQGHDGTVEVKCPNCRGKVDRNKITNHVTFKKVHFPDLFDETEEPEPEQPPEKETEAADETDSDGDSDSDGEVSLSRFIIKDEGEHDDYGPSKKAKGKGKKIDKPKKPLAQLKKEGMRNQKAKGKYLRRLEKNWVSSAKIDKAVEILQAIEDRNDGQKTIIFSQFTSLLDLLEVPVARRGWGYRRYDGSMRPPDRNAAVLDFTDKPDCKIMLVSLKAGNSGLNLVAASQVIIFDPFWNPYIEEQAIDRAHRIGQRRQVQIHRILVKETVEDRILELQDKKREVIEGALDENASKNLSRLGTRELGYLFVSLPLNPYAVYTD